MLPEQSQPLPVHALMPEAVVQRDMKTIGAYPSSSRGSARSGRKRQPKQQLQAPRNIAVPRDGAILKRRKMLDQLEPNFDTTMLQQANARLETIRHLHFAPKSVA